MGFVDKMIRGIPGDWYIFACAGVAVVCLFLVRLSNRAIDREFDEWKSENHYSRLTYRRLTVAYTLFLTLITVFPLLGMFGTVKSLLALDFSSQSAIADAKYSFFDALTSTAWGIVFALLFKLVNAFISTHADDNIRKMSELIDNKAEDLDRKASPAGR